jgi:DNA-binding NtrC family response regulator
MSNVIFTSPLQPQRSLDILIVDDEEDIRNLLAKYLKLNGHRVRTAADGIAALEAFSAASFDAVITDIDMPRMGGLELVRRIKEASPCTVTIVLTGHGTLDSATAALRQGCDDYLLKPLDNLEVIAHAIEQSISRRTALLMAASAIKVSQAKDNILDMVIEETEIRLAEIRGHILRLSPAGAESEGPRITQLSDAIKLEMAHLGAFLTDARVVHKAVREHDAN